MKTVLLHVCCGVCLGWPVEKLAREGFRVIAYFYNPNIGPLDEYQRRLSAAFAAAQAAGCEFIEGEYDQVAWQRRVEGLEEEPEGGARCAVCFRFRLENARDMAARLKADCFATTLTVSGHKNARVINAIGTSLGPAAYLPSDFKKEDGFLKTSALARENRIYRQAYCGCVYSKISFDKTTL